MKIVMSLASLRAHAATAVGVAAHVHASLAAAASQRSCVWPHGHTLFIFENQTW